ncbi:MAG TPA: RDD family protein [Trebonia sp.]|nr:RDD family protein [Trebonia sp.]
MSDVPPDPRRSSGVRLVASPHTDPGDNTPEYPGKRFGLPQAGPGAAAPMGRRLLALLIDWVLCELIVSAVTHHSVTRVNDPSYQATQYWTLVACFAQMYLLTAVSGLTIGKRLLGIRVIRTDGGRPGFAWAALRTVLLFFVVPPLLSDRDLRGLHDRAADTIVVRM